jgi:predicted nucleotidyltransferase
MKDSNLLIRVDKSVKEKAMTVVKGYGFSLSSILNAFLVEIGETGNIPLHLGVKARKNEGVFSAYPGYPLPSAKEKVLSTSTIKKLVLRIVKKRPTKFSKIFLVGSYAKGTADGNSDIDLLVYPGSDASLGDLGYLQYTLKTISKKEVDIIDAHGANPKFLHSVSKGKSLIYEN